MEIGPEGRETYRVFYRRTDFWFPGLVISLFYVSFLALAFSPSSPLSWIATFLTISVVSLISVIFWELWVARKQQRPILDLKLFQNRTFALSVAMMFVLGATLYGVNTLLPLLLQNLMHYTAEQSGITLSSGGLASLLCMPFVGFLIGKADPRKLIALGFILTAGGLFYMSGLDLQMSMGYAAKLRFMQSLGLGFLFIPISTMSYVGIAPEKNNDVAGMTNLARNIGGSCGTAIFTTMLARHEQLHQNVLVSHAVRDNAFFSEQISQLTHLYGAPGALLQLYQRLQQQANRLLLVLQRVTRSRRLRHYLPLS